ncbi:MAG: glycosyltransferase family 4 protein [Phycisphaeraceae bacterium]|nr:glycosyltransferase family 4 protein [Phycisphaerales bacterium]QOJ17382.1 MAG: glycosyltransferase family 4 protein [Phycisphaeraceae bacterium]
MSLRIMHISTRLILGGSQENTVLSCEGQVRRGHAVALVYGPIYGPEGSLYDRAAAFRAGEDVVSRQPLGATEDGGQRGEAAEGPHDRAAEPPNPGARNPELGTRNAPGTQHSALGTPHSPTSSRRIELIETPNLVRELAPLKDRRCLRDLRRIIRDWKPDVVHTHSSKAGILGRLAAWKERVPCIIHTIHGLPFHPYEKKWRNAVYILSERIAARRCHRIVCVADAMRDQALAAGIGRPEQYVTVYSGMEIDSFLHPRWTREQVRRELGVAEHEFILGTVARLAELKGHDDLIDALGPLMHERPSLRLLWVGDGWWRDRLFARLRDAGLAGRVITTGLVPPEEVPKYVQAMDCLAHPSYREGLPRTVPQALLSARPVIAYDVDGTKECCRDGETGRLVKPGDLPGLCEAVRWMMDHPKERTAMGVAGRELCRTRFSAETMVDELERVYASVLEHRGGRSAGRGARR